MQKAAFSYRQLMQKRAKKKEIVCRPKEVL
jgi:hypothetical protein